MRAECRFQAISRTSIGIRNFFAALISDHPKVLARCFPDHFGKTAKRAMEYIAALANLQRFFLLVCAIIEYCISDTAYFFSSFQPFLSPENAIISKQKFLEQDALYTKGTWFSVHSFKNIILCTIPTKTDRHIAGLFFPYRHSETFQRSECS